MDMLLSLVGEQVLSTCGWAWRGGGRGRGGRALRGSVQRSPKTTALVQLAHMTEDEEQGPAGTPRSQCTPGGTALGHQPGCQVRGCAETPLVSMERAPSIPAYYTPASEEPIPSRS